jgi:DNA mismatch endonuclease (patch repair protein)
MDDLTPSQRHTNMSHIHSNDTKPEMIVRKWLWHHGFRYQLHRKDLPGKPDIVLPKYHTVIFVNGCFWHRHGCKYTTTPATHQEFWEKKFAGNVERDKREVAELKKSGWRVLIVWECEVKDWNEQLEGRILTFLKFSLQNVVPLSSVKNIKVSFPITTYNSSHNFDLLAAESEPDYDNSNHLNGIGGA